MNEVTRLSWTDVRDEIRMRILNRTYAPGDKLPRDEDIALELGCARSTVHRAMQELSQVGLIERKRKGDSCAGRSGDTGHIRYSDHPT